MVISRHKHFTAILDRECPHCRDTKAFLKENHIKAKYIDVNSRKGQKIAEKVSKGDNIAVPIISVCDNSKKDPLSDSCEVLIGFEKHKVSKALGL